jgi:sulfur-oxidizing protein SoxY
MKWFVALLSVSLLMAGTAGAVSPAVPDRASMADPLDSPRWEDMRKTFFGKARVVFDDRVKVVAPVTAENSLNVPVGVDAAALSGVTQVLVFADFNPINEVLRFYPERGLAKLGFRVKLQQSTPVRAAARTADGVWHVNGVWVNTAGGGCTAPSVGSSSPEWQSRLNEVSGRVWSREAANEGVSAASSSSSSQSATETPKSPDQLRLRLRIIHPMDTGLVAGIPAFFIQQLRLADEKGRGLMRIEAYEPVAENPVFTIDLPAGLAASRVQVTGRDNGGNAIETWVEP